MKKLIIAAIALTTAASVFAQGSISFGSRYLATAGNQTIHIWGPSPTAPTLSLVGLGSNDAGKAGPGTTPFAASGMVMIGQDGTAGVTYNLANGKTWNSAPGGAFAQLLGGAVGAAESSLVPVGITCTFRSGTAAGGWTTFTETLAGFPEGSAGTFELVAWDSSTYKTWTDALAAWKLGNVAIGRGGLFNLSAIGGSALSSPQLNQQTPLNSFNLAYFASTTIPEPSSFALAGLGAAALLIFRRRK
jgi:hypothetical protein